MWLRSSPLTRAARLSDEDLRASQSGGRRFARGARPVIRWIKGDGLDDEVTRAAIGQATRLFGDSVDYCLCSEGISAPRARNILAWATQPVEWWPVTPTDNPWLADRLEAAGCTPDRYGYWWKWFPERVRPHGPEWILDGDMVITGRPGWFEYWQRGADGPRLSQDDRSALKAIHGRYAHHVDPVKRFYSGLASLPPGRRYLPAIAKILGKQPLAHDHDGRKHMCEQGVIAAAFQQLDAVPIPLHEFPFARAFQTFIDHGHKGDLGHAWGYHFGNAFRRHNPHFERLSAEGVIFTQPAPDALERFQWLGGHGQWGIPGWTTPPRHARNLITHARPFVGRQVLEIGTSRGKLGAMLATLGCRVTTVDHVDRGAAQNLAGLDVQVVVDDAVHFMATTARRFDLVLFDMHGNSPADWQRYAAAVRHCLAPAATLLLSNATLDEVQGWSEESGVKWFIDNLPSGWRSHLDTSTVPGVAVISTP
ncbi:MAG: hypothetical protein RL434_1594 [Pseudomonadota bacterium]